MKKADPAKRLVAFLIDNLIMQFVGSLLSLPFMCLFFVPGIFSSSPKDEMAGVVVLFFCCIGGLVIILSLAISYAYYIYYPVKRWGGATIGKRVMKLKVVKIDNSEVGQMDLFIREFIGKFFSGIIFYLGYIWILIDEKGQGWHDKLADTLVVETEDQPEFSL